MKKSDMLTMIGLLIGAGLLVNGMMSGSSLMIFWDVPSVLITVGGSFAAVLMVYSMEDIKLLGKLIGQIFSEKKISSVEIVRKFAHVSKKARREGLLSLEDDISDLEDEFMKKGLQMVVDGIEPDTIKDILELEIDEMENRHNNSASIFSAWGVYAPAFGMIGTLIGLIQMLQNLTDISNIASGMGKALITTFYGSLLANLFCIPMAANLKQKSAKEVSLRQLMLEGVLAIQSGVNPRIVEEKLLTYLSPKDKAEYMNSVSEDNEGVAE